MNAWEKADSGALVMRTDAGVFTVQRHGEGRKYWGVTYPDGTYTHTALTQGEAKEQAEAWEPDPTLVQLELGQDALTRELVARVIADAEPMKPAGRGYYSYNSTGEKQQKALGALRDLKALRDAVETAIREQVEVARTNTGNSWTSNAARWDDVGEALGVTKQSAASRFGVKTA